MALDEAGNLYVSESSNHRVLVYDANGALLKKLSGLKKPLGVAVDGSGRIYVCNAGSRDVSVYSGGLTLVRRLGTGKGEFVLPTAVAVGPSGTVYVVDAKADTVKAYRADGSFLFSFGGPGNEDGRFHFPTSIAVDAASGEVVVSDLQLTATGVQGARIQVFDANGAFRRKFGAYGRGEGLLMKPLGTAVGGGGRIYVSDAYQNIVHVFDGHGTYVKTVYDMDHPMRTPLGLAVSRTTGRLYVASLNSSTVEVYGDGTGEGQGSGSLSFSSSGGGGCSVAAGPPGGAASSWGWALPLVALSLGLLLRKKAAGGRRRPGRTTRR